MSYLIPELADLTEEAKIEILILIMSVAPITWTKWLLGIAKVPRRTLYLRAFNTPCSWNKNEEDYTKRVMITEDQLVTRVEGAKAMLATREIDFWVIKYLEESIQNRRLLTHLASMFPRSQFTIHVRNEGLQTN